MNAPAASAALALAVTLPLAATAQERSGQAAALQQLAKMQVHEGLEVKLFASEPMVRNPANMDIDARGRVWCTEGVNYRTWQKWGKLQPEGDRITILEDTNGDGEADVQKTFYQGNEVNTALGICVLGDRILVSCSPNVLVFEDRNHDDKADGPPVKMFTGIKGVDHDHGMHAFVFGPDGRLYFNFGNEGRNLNDAQGKPITDLAGNVINNTGKPYRQGMVFRSQPDGSRIETLGWNFRNNYEISVDSFGSLWQSDNDDDGNQGVRINFVMEFGNYGYTGELTGSGWGQRRSNQEPEVPRRHWHLNDPGVVPNLLQTGAGSPTGITVYEGDLLPEPFRGQMIHCDAGPRVVRAYPVEKDGAGYKGTLVNLLTSTDDWYRPSDVCVAPDGAVFIADWNDAGVGGHYMADQKAELMTGRVYRVAPKNHKSSVPALDLTSPKGAVAALLSPNLATRHLAWNALQGLGSAADAELAKVWTENSNPRFRARALHVLARRPGQELARVNEALGNSDSDLRITGLRIARERGLDLIPLLARLVDDPSAQVRRECAIALRHHKSPEAPKLWARLARKHDGKDRWYLEALGIGADLQWDACLAAYLAEAGNDATQTPAGRDILWRSRAKQTPALLAKLIKDPAATEADKARYFRAFDFQSGPEKDAALVELLSASAK
jgi:putative membrane-bound dehydrogenase-like protein